MITKWKVFNFKSIRRETELDLAPLTVFAGSNSSGKSTVLQSMLLIAQTLSNKVSSRSVVLNADLVRLGQFDDLRSHDSDIDQILIGWACAPDSIGSSLVRTESSRRIARYSDFTPSKGDVFNCEITFDADPSDPTRELLQLRPKLFSCTMSMTAADGSRNSLNVVRSPTRQSEFAGTSLTPDTQDTKQPGLEYSVEMDEDLTRPIREEYPSHEIVGCDLHHFAPRELLLKVDTLVEDAKLIARAMTDDLYRSPQPYRSRNLIIPEIVWKFLGKKFGEDELEKLTTLILTDRTGRQVPLMPQLIRLSVRDWHELAYRRINSSRSTILRALRRNPDLQREIFTLVKDSNVQLHDETRLRYEIIPIPVPNTVALAFGYFENFFTNSLQYLGPLRDEPKPVYPFSVSPAPTHVGLRGELTAAVLELNKDQQVEYVAPQTLVETGKRSRRVVRTLHTAVTEWLQYLGVADAVKTRDRGKLGHEMHIAVDSFSRATDLTHVGVGVSQLLPIVVMCLIAEPDTTLVFEQPELHLHPRVQTLLGDFFLAMALSGRQCVIETHSEYLINRLRYRAASAPIEDSLTSSMKIYFVEKKEGTSAFREIVVNDYGAILDWPDGFFDQSQDEADRIIRAATRKRKTPQKGDGNA